ncbi:hypothetical protein IscW_ISCW014540 [Ixodes scapularis]|uniref:Uncharacterized protein n=1 Tax=Ixodes scapularis TaxID=6945 RepID=B7QK92_IXOSC|nr:hypothetical protein IscW_ISCW014540 [Ixodes scapularis]|eukprot:XP_002415599.1 hypothetical protein IscW_ISCW014540 [Ixodes scapularis]
METQLAPGERFQHPTGRRLEGLVAGDHREIASDARCFISVWPWYHLEQGTVVSPRYVHGLGTDCRTDERGRLSLFHEVDFGDLLSAMRKKGGGWRYLRKP